MQEIYHPVDHELEPSHIGDENIEQLLKLMERQNIKKVYSVFHLDDFFGIPGQWISLHEPGQEPEEIEYWAEWRRIDKGSDEHEILAGRGIEVIFYDETRSP